MEYVTHIFRMLITLIFIGSYFLIYFLLFLIAISPILVWGINKVTYHLKK